MRRVFFIVGPTAIGKSELGADVAHELNAEIVSADAFQIYRGLDLLTAKPDALTFAKAPHHLIGTMPLSEEMNAEKYRRLALRAIDEIHSRGKLSLVVGGSGLYVKALSHGLAPLPEANPKLRQKLNAMSLDELRSRLAELDPETVRKIDTKNRRRLVRALEICLLTGKLASEVVAGGGLNFRCQFPSEQTNFQSTHETATIFCVDFSDSFRIKLSEPGAQFIQAHCVQFLAQLRIGLWQRRESVAERFD